MGQFVIGALTPSIREQAKQQGLAATGMRIEEVDEVSNQLTRYYIWGLLTESEINRARQRLLKRAAFKKLEIV